jgi:uncharacterized Zn finger protein
LSRYYQEWAPYVSTAQRRKQAERELARRRKAGHPVAPVIIRGRAIATTFWGKAWCANLQSYRDYENRLPRGRTYVRNGSVVDLQIAPRTVRALVSGSSVYTVTVRIAALPKAPWRSICRDCAGGIDSLIELLRGRFSRGVMERLCRQGQGLFPRPSEIEFSCSCPDHASMCKHVAAVLYGVGTRLDEKPELLFRLRAVDERDLVADLDGNVLLSTAQPTSEKILQSDDISALFGIEMAAGDAPGATQAATRKRDRTPSKPVAPKKPETMHRTARRAAPKAVKIAAPLPPQTATPEKRIPKK